MNEMTYDQAVGWLNTSQQFGIKLGLHRISKILEHLDHPERNIPSIHVAGTNGKGSVCQYLSSILSKEGYQVGLFTSPHLETVRERFCINNELISTEEFTTLISTLKDVVDGLKNHTFQPTYFELCTALAFLFFNKHNVDYGIIEVGLGGKYDSTNICIPIISIITNIHLDHQRILGETIEKIATEKAGIIRDCVPIITAAEGKALGIIKKQANKHHAPLIIVKSDTSSIVKRATEYQLIKINGFLDEYNLETNEIGGYQKQNLSLAIYAIEQLQILGIFISPESIQYGVKSMVHQGRMKIIHTKPMVIIDGAHNPKGLQELRNSIISLFPSKRIILIFGVLKDKNINGMINEIHSICNSIILTKPSNNRAAEPINVKHIIETMLSKKELFVTKNVTQAIKIACNLADEDDLILITGSLYLVEKSISYFKKND